MNKCQRSLINCYCEIMKKWYETYLYTNIINEYELTHSTLRIYTNKDNLSKYILDQISSIATKRKVYYTILIKNEKIVITLSL